MFIWLVSITDWIISSPIADGIISLVLYLVTFILIRLLAAPLFFILVDLRFISLTDDVAPFNS